MNKNFQYLTKDAILKDALNILIKNKKERVFISVVESERKK